jgi:hypothetical protein
MHEIQHLIKTKQFFAAVGKLVLREGAKEDETVTRVSEIVDKAIEMNTAGDLRKIMKQFGRWVDRDTTERAVTLLNETTDIDPMPDEFHPDELV